MVGGANTGHGELLNCSILPPVQYPTQPWYQPMVFTDSYYFMPDVVPMASRSSPVAYWLTTTSPTSYSAAPFRLKMNHFLGYPSRFLLCLNMTGPTTLSCLKCLGRRPREYKLQFGGSRSLNSRERLFTIRFETIQVSSLEIADILTIIGQ